MDYSFLESTPRENSNAQKYLLREKLFKTKDVLPLWIADMDIDTPDFIIRSIQERLKHPVFGYEEFLKSAFEAQQKWIYKKYGFEFDKKDMFYSPSVVLTMNLVIDVFSEVGDKVIVQPPIYPPFFNSIIKHKREVLYNPLKIDKDGKYRFDIDDLKSKIDKKTKLLLLCSPHNPVGRVWKRDELEEILEICLKHNILVFSDEIHSDLIYNPNKHIPFASLNDKAKDITITAMGVGKTFNMAGFAISSVIITNQVLRDRFYELYSRIHIAQGSTLSYVAMESAYKNGHIWLEDLKKHLLCNYEMLKEVCNRYDDKIRLTNTEATYLAWLDCRGMGMSNKELRSFFTKEARLGLSAGLSFGKEGSGFMRLNFAVSSTVMKEIVSRLSKALGKRYDKD